MGQLVQKLPLRLHLRDEEIPGGDVAGGDAEAVPQVDDAHEEIILRLVQGLAAGEGSGGHHPDHLPPHQPLGQLGILHLLGDGHLVALLHQLGQVGFHRMVGDAAHGRPLLEAALLPCEGEA